MADRNPEFERIGKQETLRSLYELTKEHSSEPRYWSSKVVSKGTEISPPLPSVVNGSRTYNCVQEHMVGEFLAEYCGSGLVDFVLVNFSDNRRYRANLGRGDEIEKILEE